MIYNIYNIVREYESFKFEMEMVIYIHTSGKLPLFRTLVNDPKFDSIFLENGLHSELLQLN